MDDSELIDDLYRWFHSAHEEIFADRIGHLPIGDLPFTDPVGTPFGNIKHLVRGDDKSGAAFDICQAKACPPPAQRQQGGHPAALSH
jgi:hypothetical protein